MSTRRRSIACIRSWRACALVSACCTPELAACRGEDRLRLSAADRCAAIAAPLRAYEAELQLKRQLFCAGSSGCLSDVAMQTRRACHADGPCVTPCIIRATKHQLVVQASLLHGPACHVEHTVHMGIQTDDIVSTFISGVECILFYSILFYITHFLYSLYLVYL